MALFPKTPGVYIQEIQTLPSSVAAVPTAIPVFVGYTESGDLNKPTRVTSLIEFQQHFGGAFNENITVTLTGTPSDIAIAFTNPAEPQFRLFYDLQMFFANGGGTCYIITVGHYNTSPSIVAADLKAAIAFAEQVDEISMIVVPEAVAPDVDDNGRRDIYNEMLAHCAKMQDRFSIMDVLVRSGNTVFDDAQDFRNSNVGANNLKYGAAYYPSLESGLSFAYLDSSVTISALIPPLPFNTNTLDVVKNGIFASVHITFNSTFNAVDLLIGGISIAPSGSIASAGAIASAINTNPLLNSTYSATVATDVIVTTKTAGIPNSIAVTGPATTSDVTVSLSVSGILPDTLLYSRITSALQTFPLILYPSATMAGTYTAVDNDRGVWKAAANVSVNVVDSLGVTITDSEQGDLNIDPVGGKSINAIRNFAGRGNLVWGARTLAGNDNEWRYINVRRLFLFAEDSIRHASEFVVFEPNDKNTWMRVKSMISNFLTDLWKQGALTGDKPEQAYFVKVGLNETMTAQDILEGKLIIQVGLAAVRPAEFIILQFMHKLQEA